jgi:hypothetical protein
MKMAFGIVLTLALKRKWQRSTSEIGGFKERPSKPIKISAFSDSSDISLSNASTSPSPEGDGERRDRRDSFNLSMSRERAGHSGEGGLMF